MLNIGASVPLPAPHGSTPPSQAYWEGFAEKEQVRVLVRGLCLQDVREQKDPVSVSDSAELPSTCQRSGPECGLLCEAGACVEMLRKHFHRVDRCQASASRPSPRGS